jgi:lysophospholipid acyltransferase (LPLAT)-like uncharacterized protein
MRDAQQQAGQRNSGVAPDRARRHSFAARAVGYVIANILRLLSATWRIEKSGSDALEAALAGGEKILFVFWHGKYVPLFPLLSGLRGCVFTSVSFRGDIIAEICRRFGFGVVQIPDEGGEQSLALMREALSFRRCGAIAVDGPLGPWHAVHRGAIRLASELGYALVPVSFAAARKLVRDERWDRMEFPAARTRLCAAFGEPMFVPGDLTDDELGAWKARIGAALAALDRETARKIEAARTA